MKKWIVMLFAIAGAFAYGGHEDSEYHPARQDRIGLANVMVVMLA